jgi:PAB-dependent poly(A)-specific ribonuclease subunit 3
LNCVGIYDVVNYDGRNNITQHQQEDLLALAQLVLVLACRSMSALQNLAKSIDFVVSNYSVDIKNFIVLLFSKPTISISDICPLISGHILNEMDHIQ